MDRRARPYGALPSKQQDIMRYVQQLLTPQEQKACDMATD